MNSDNPVIDVNVINSLASETSEEVVQRLLKMYAEELTETIQVLEASYPERPEDLKKALHKAKNSSATFGAAPLLQRIVSAEQLLRAGSDIEPEHFEELTELGRRTISAIQSL